MFSNPGRLAWITVLVALAIFCSLCAGTILLGRWIVFESPTSLNTTVVVARGIVRLDEPDTPDEKAVRIPTGIGNRDRVSTDTASQGYLAFADPYSNDTIATVMFRSDSSVQMISATRPRFSLSDNPYVIRLKDAQGRLEVWIRPDLEREIRLDIESENGRVRLGESGTYLLSVAPAFLKVTPLEGSAALIGNNEQAYHITRGSEAVLYRDSPIASIYAGPIELLPNSSLETADKAEWPVEWRCAYYPSPDNPNGPPGEVRFKTTDGLSVAHITRLAPDPGPGGEGCEQSLGGQTGLNVEQYEAVRLRVKMQIHHQDLSACGVLGSECPVMLYMEYIDRYGNERLWYHGFYAEYTLNVGRTRCDSCLEEHERLQKDAWYTYEIDLLTDLPEDLRPSVIKLVKVYAGGHQFDVMLSDVSLLATAPIPESIAPAGS